MLNKTILFVGTLLFASALCAQTGFPSAGLGETSIQPARPAAAAAPYYTISQQCAAGEIGKERCKFRWRAAISQTVAWTLINHTGNIVVSPNVRYETFHGSFFRKYGRAVANYQWGRWSDGDPWYINDIAHPMMGSVFSYIQIQNDPRGATLEVGRSGAYWKSRLRAMAFAAVAAAQWELGPLSECAIGNTGYYQYWSRSNREWTNGTGVSDLVMTPAGGFVWMLAEDALDKLVMKKVEGEGHSRIWLLAGAVLTPTRSTANLMRLRAPWYRDRRARSTR
jgi:hypothetical protein